MFSLTLNLHHDEMKVKLLYCKIRGANKYSKRNSNYMCSINYNMLSLELHKTCWNHKSHFRQNHPYCIYISMYKSNPCTSQPPISRSKIGFFIISSKRKIQTDRKFPSVWSLISENVLKTQWIKKKLQCEV